MNIVIDTHLAFEFPDELQKLQNRYPSHSWSLIKGDSQAYGANGESSVNIQDAHVYIGGPLSPEIYEMANNLRVHIIPYTGVNRFPLEIIKKKGIILANNHGNSVSVAERALALAMAVSGRIVEFHNDFIQGNWHRNQPPFPVFDLWTSLVGARISVLGTGAIGQAFGQLISGFHGELTGFRRNPTAASEKPFDRVTNDLQQALGEKDLILLALPSTSETIGLIGERELNWARDAIIVNVSRAEIIEEKALYQSLHDKVIRGAGLDVWYRYPDPYWSRGVGSQYDFSVFPNVVMSPHAASHSIRGKCGQWLHTIDQLSEYLETGTLFRRVDLELGY